MLKQQHLICGLEVPGNPMIDLNSSADLSIENSVIFPTSLLWSFSPLAVPCGNEDPKKRKEMVALHSVLTPHQLFRSFLVFFSDKQINDHEVFWQQRLKLLKHILPSSKRPVI